MLFGLSNTTILCILLVIIVIGLLGVTKFKEYSVYNINTNSFWNDIAGRRPLSYRPS